MGKISKNELDTSLNTEINKIDILETKIADIGDKTTLRTSDKSSTVNAINEIDFNLDTHLTSNYHLPSGIIVMWSGAINNIPVGFNLCDGTQGTPDLRNRFIVGAGTTYTVGNTGGSDNVTLTSGQMPSHSHTASTGSDSHSHTGSTSTAGSHTHLYSQIAFSVLNEGTGTGTSAATDYNQVATGTGGDHSHTLTINSDSHNHTVTVNSTGSGQSHENRPPYYALAYIMKL